MAILKDTTIAGSLYVTGQGEINGCEISAIVEISDNHIRYANGIQVCYGVIASAGTTNDHTTTITFSKAFKSGTTPAVCGIAVRTDNYSDSNYKHLAKNITNTKFEYTDWMIRSTSDKISYIAIGKWK